MDKKSIYIIVAVAIIAVGIWFWFNQPVSNAPVGGTFAPVGVTPPQGGAVTEADNTASINQDLNNITVEDPDFNTIDTDLNSL
ncbi:MAG: hypothetical protein Q7K44_02275 [Candidatus Liptonbacteria bacterium]|nr:hypothetical protein [Candidatus Liptonbacteria bacterium]